MRSLGWVLIKYDWYPYAAAAAAKSLQSCPTLREHIDGSPQGSPWDSPGKNTGVGCHFLLQCMKVESESEVAQSCPTLSDPMDCSQPGSSVHGIFHIELVMPSNHLILCRLLLLPPSIFPSIRVFSIESVLRIVWPKYWSFSFSISPSNEYSGVISLRIDWFDLLAVQGTLKSLASLQNTNNNVL